MSWKGASPHAGAHPTSVSPGPANRGDIAGDGPAPGEGVVLWGTQLDDQSNLEALARLARQEDGQDVYRQFLQSSDWNPTPDHNTEKEADENNAEQIFLQSTASSSRPAADETPAATQPAKKRRRGAARARPGSSERKWRQLESSAFAQSPLPD